MSLPCDIPGLPVMELTHTQERIASVLSDRRVHSRADVEKAIWHHRPPANPHNCLAVAMHGLREALAPHGLLIHRDGDGYALVEDTRRFR